MKEREANAKSWSKHLKNTPNNKFIIKGRLSGLNEYTTANRIVKGNFYKGASVKRENQDTVINAIREAKLSVIDKYPLTIKTTYYEPNNRRDIDNVSFAIKFILDSLVKTGIIPDDSKKYVNKRIDVVVVDRNNPRIEVELINDE